MHNYYNIYWHEPYFIILLAILDLSNLNYVFVIPEAGGDSISKIESYCPWYFGYTNSNYVFATFSATHFQNTELDFGGADLRNWRWNGGEGGVRSCPIPRIWYTSYVIHSAPSHPTTRNLVLNVVYSSCGLSFSLHDPFIKDPIHSRRYRETLSALRVSDYYP